MRRASTGWVRTAASIAMAFALSGCG